jgi:hypothetical protein
MSRILAKSFQQHPVKLAIGMAIHVGGALALVAQL